MNMNSPTTRERLLDSATTLFAEHGFRGAAVRDICNQARVNPGAVSYHFGGKRQLYRAVLRAAVEDLSGSGETHGDDESQVELADRYLKLVQRIRARPALARLVVRDLADGGQMALEATAPALRGVREAITDAVGASDGPTHQKMVNNLLLLLASPIALAASSWPFLARALQLDEDDLTAFASQVAASLRAQADPAIPEP
jgi:AcrR family transcriptional regulator